MIQRFKWDQEIKFSFSNDSKSRFEFFVSIRFRLWHHLCHVLCHLLEPKQKILLLLLWRMIWEPTPFKRRTDRIYMVLLRQDKFNAAFTHSLRDTVEDQGTEKFRGDHDIRNWQCLTLSYVIAYCPYCHMSYVICHMLFIMTYPGMTIAILGDM